MTALCPNYSAYTAIHRLHGFIFFHKITLYPVFVKKISTFRPQIFNFFVSLFANLML